MRCNNSAHYFLVNNDCIKSKSQNCLTVDVFGNCLSCYIERLRYNVSVELYGNLDLFSKSYLSNGNCTKINQFSLENEVCTAIDDNLKCTQCLKGYYLKIDGAFRYCKLCDPNCTCESAAQPCTGCVNEKFYLSAGQCLPCGANINQCQINGAITSCEPGYFANGGVSCTLCPANCISCPNSANCSQCQSKFYLDYLDK